MTGDVFTYFPSFQVLAFTDVNEFKEAFERETGKKCVDDGSRVALCVTIPDDEFVSVKNFILLRWFDRDDDQSIGYLVHEASHAVDGFLDRIGEDNPGGELRAYLTQGVVMSCLQQLGESGDAATMCEKTCDSRLQCHER